MWLCNDCIHVCLSISAYLSNRHLKLSMSKTEVQTLFSSPNLFSHKLQIHHLPQMSELILTSFLYFSLLTADSLHYTSEYIQNLTDSHHLYYSLSPSAHLFLGFCSRLLVGLYLCSLSTSVANDYPHYLNDFFVIVKGSGGSGNEARFLKPET